MSTPMMNAMHQAPGNTNGSHFVILGPFPGQTESSHASSEFTNTFDFGAAQTQPCQMPSTPCSRKSSMGYMDYQMNSMSNAFTSANNASHSALPQANALMPSNNMFAANNFATTNNFTTASNPFSTNPLAVNNAFAPTGNFLAQVQQYTAEPQHMFQQPSVLHQHNDSFHTYDHNTPAMHEAAESHTVEEEPSVDLHGTRFTKSQIIEIYSLRSAATAGEDAMHKKAAGRSVVVAQLYNLPAKTVRDIWTRDVCAEWTSDQWTRHEQVLYECQELIKTGQLPPRTERLRSATTLLQGSDCPVGTPASPRRVVRGKRKSISEGDDKSKKTKKLETGADESTPTASVASEFASWPLHPASDLQHQLSVGAKAEISFN